MSKNKGKNKNNTDKKLRAQLEILKAQLKSENDIKYVSSAVPTKDIASSMSTQVQPLANTASSSAGLKLNIGQIKKDLYSTGVFSAIAVALILILKITENRWLGFFNF